MKFLKKLKCKLFGHDNKHSYLRYKQINFDKLKEVFKDSLFEIDTDQLFNVIKDKYLIGKAGGDYCNNCNKLYTSMEFNKDFDDFIKKQDKDRVYSIKDLRESMKNYANHKKNSIYSIAIPNPREGGFEKFMNK